MSAHDRVRDIVAPLVDGAGLDLYDLELGGGIVRVLVDTAGGADMEAVSRVTREISRALDEHDPIAGSYTLEVSTPGLERPLRTPAHYAAAMGSTVKVKTRPGLDGDRRIEATISAADDDTVTLSSADGTSRTLRYDDIERARTTFEWGPAPKHERTKQ